MGGLAWIDLRLLSDADNLDLDDLCTMAELAAGQRIHNGDLAGLTSDEWLARWRTFRQRHPHCGTDVAIYLPQTNRKEAEADFTKAMQLKLDDPQVWKERGRLSLLAARRLSWLHAYLPMSSLCDAFVYELLSLRSGSPL